MTDEKRDKESGEERTTWPMVLFFACLGLGFAASAVEYERVTATAQRNRADVLAAVDSVMEGRMEDLGKFLSNPQTQLIHLASTADSGFAGAVIAWNSSEQRGYLMCDQLPVLNEGDKYEALGDQFCRRRGEAGEYPGQGREQHLFFRGQRIARRIGSG